MSPRKKKEGQREEGVSPTVLRNGEWVADGKGVKRWVERKPAPDLSGLPGKEIKLKGDRR